MAWWPRAVSVLLIAGRSSASTRAVTDAARQQLPTVRPLEALAAIAAQQYGVVTRRQARDAGVSRWRIERLVADGAWIAETPSTLRSASAPRTAEQMAQITLLDLGPRSALCRPSSLAALRVESFSLLPVHVSVPRRQRSRLVEPGRMHTSLHLDDDHVGMVGGLRVVIPELTLIDCAGWLAPTRLEHVVDRLWARRLLDPARALAFTETVGRGHRNIRALRALLEARADGQAPPESGLEARFHKLLRDAGEAPMRRQVEVGGRRLIGRVDAVDDDARLIVEIQSVLYHGSISDRRRDAARRQALEAEGWTVLEVWEDRILTDGPALVREIAALRRSLRAQRAS